METTSVGLKVQFKICGFYNLGHDSVSLTLHWFQAQADSNRVLLNAFLANVSSSKTDFQVSRTCNAHLLPSFLPFLEVDATSCLMQNKADESSCWLPAVIYRNPTSQDIILNLKLFKVFGLEGMKYSFQIQQRKTEVNNGKNRVWCVWTNGLKWSLICCLETVSKWVV